MKNLRDWLRRKQETARQPKGVAWTASRRGSISVTLQENVQELQRIFSQTPDLVIRHLHNQANDEKAVLVYLSGLADKNQVDEHIIRPFLVNQQTKGIPISDVISVGRMDVLTDWSSLEMAILLGNCLLFVEGKSEVYVIEASGWPQRAIEDPKNEASILGSHQGFVESSEQNIAMIRRYIPSSDLKIIELEVGIRGRCTVSVLYLADVASPDVLKEMVKRIK